MPRSSRHKSSSHKQSKHSSKEATREYSDSDSDFKMKERNGKEESSGGGGVGGRVSKDLASGEKRKLASQSRESKDPYSHVNDDASAEDYVSSKRRKEKADGSVGGDRWNGGGGDEPNDGAAATREKETKVESLRVDSEKGSKGKGLGDSKSKTSKRHESSGDKKEENVSGAAMEKEDSKSNRVDSKLKSDKEAVRKEYKDSKEPKESKDKERGSERKVQDVKRDTEARVGDVEVGRKQISQPPDFSEDKRSKRELSIQDEAWNPESEKESDKRIRRRKDQSSDKYEDDSRETDDRRLSSRGDRAKDGRYKDEKLKDGNYGDKYREDGEKDKRYRDEKYHEDADRDERHRDSKHWEDGERDNRRKDDKNWEDGERDSKRRDDKYREDGERDSRRRDDKYREDGERESRRRDDKYREDGGRDNKRSDDRYREGDKEDRRREGDRDNSHKEDKHREDVDRDARHRDGRQGDEIDKEKRLRDAKYREEHTSRDRASDNYDTKQLRDEISAADLPHRKLNNQEVSPSYDDRIGRHKDGQGRRRASNKEDYSDSRSRGTKEHRLDAEKRSMSSAKSDMVADKGRSSSRNADVDLVLNHSRRRSSPSAGSLAANDHYRLSKQEESKYKDYPYEDRMRHSVSFARDSAGASGGEKGSLPHSLEKPSQKDDSHFGDLPVDRRLKLEARVSPLRRLDKSPSSTSADRRYSNRLEVRQSFDVEESGQQRSGGSKDAKDYLGKEGKGSRELPVDELSLADGDNISVSSPFPRSGNFSGNSKTLLPLPPPFRAGVDSPVAFGSAEDDNRGKSNSRHRRMVDPNMGRGQGSAWKGVPNWPSPVANGFMPFQHGPPPVGFHPMMQQFPAPIFGVRPGMEVNHTGVPYHIPDAERFSGHGRPLGWRGHVDDSCPPLHGWDSNNSMFAEETQIYGRLDWDNGRTQMSSSQGWETSGDMWKGQNSGLNGDLPTASQKESSSARGSVDEVWPGKSGQQAQNEQMPAEPQAENIDISKSNERNTPDAPKGATEESSGVFEMSKLDNEHFCQVYLSKLDISAELTQPRLYSECTSLVNICPNTTSDEDCPKILYVEKVGEAKAQIPHKISNASLFAAISDSVFQKAMSIYKKQREDTAFVDGEKVSIGKLENLEHVPPVDQDVAGASDFEPGKLDPACDHQEADGDKLNSVYGKALSSITSLEVGILPAKAEQSSNGDGHVTPESLIDLEKSGSVLGEGNMESNQVANQEELFNVTEDKALHVENMESSGALSPFMAEGIERSNGLGGNCLPHNNEEQKLLFSDVSSEAMMPESSGLVNLSRIHHSPESTH